MKRREEPRSDQRESQTLNRTYEAPRLETLGKMSDVTRKSGLDLDTNQVTKPGGGGG